VDVPLVSQMANFHTCQRFSLRHPTDSRTGRGQPPLACTLLGCCSVEAQRRIRVPQDRHVLALETMTVILSRYPWSHSHGLQHLTRKVVLLVSLAAARRARGTLLAVFHLFSSLDCQGSYKTLIDAHLPPSCLC